MWIGDVPGEEALYVYSKLALIIIIIIININRQLVICVIA